MTSSVANSTNKPLLADGMWVGLWEVPADTTQGIQLLINTDVDGTAYLQFSQEKTRVEYEHTYSVLGGISLYVVERRKAKYVRVKYVNGETPQTLMLLHTTYVSDYERETQPITTNAEDSNILIFAETPSGGLSSIKSDASGTLLVKEKITRIEQILLNEDVLGSDTGSPIYDVVDYRKCVLSYIDSDATSTGTLAVYGSTDDTNVSYIGEIIPIKNPHTLMRYASVNLDLSAFSGLQIINQTDAQIGAITAKLFGVV
jgi:hypothetical protein